MGQSLLAILVISTMTFILYAYDKRCAQLDLWRIPESILLFMAAAGGAMGALAAMYICHHKTKKSCFVNGIPFMIVCHTLLLIVLANMFLYE